MAAARSLLLSACLLALASCSGGDEGAEAEWLRARLPRGARVAAEGAAGGRSLEDWARVRRISSLADLPESELAASEFLLFDSRVYARSVRRGGAQAGRYRVLARDPDFEVVGLLEGNDGRGRTLLLLQRAESGVIEVDSDPIALRCDGARLAGEYFEPRPWGLVRLRLRASDEHLPELRFDHQVVTWERSGDGLLSAVFTVAAGVHALESDDELPRSPEVVRLLSRQSLRENQRLETLAVLLAEPR